MSHVSELETLRPSQKTSIVTIIERPKGWIPIDLASIWHYRDLLFYLAWREIAVRYQQTIVGASWAIIQPFLTMVIFSLFFGQLARLPSDGVPYPIFSYVALLPWQYFASTLGNASNSLVANSNLISKVYFPRLIMPLSAALPGLVDFAIALIILFGMMIYYGVSLTWNVIWLPFFLLLALVTALGVSLWLSAINVRYRDVRYVVPFLIQLWQFASPVAYSTSLVPQEWQLLYSLNPMTGVINGFRWALLGTEFSSGPLLVSILIPIVVLVSGAFFFRQVEKSFADVI